MEDNLKNIKEKIKENTFKDLQFGHAQRQAVFRKIKVIENIDKPNLFKQVLHNRFRVLLTILAYCGMLTLITTIILNYVNEPEPIQSGHSGVVDKPEKPIDEQPSKDLDPGLVLTEREYIDETFSFKLSFPESWINKVKVEKIENGLRFYLMGTDGIPQNIVTLNIEKVEERLKFFYEGGPDPSTDFALLDDHVYRYYLPLDLGLTNEEDITEFGKLSAEVPAVIKSFTFTNNKGGFIGETPYIYGFTPQYNEQYGFEVNTPNKWQNLFTVEESDKEMKFLFQKEGTEPTEFFSIKFLTEQEWKELQSDTNEEIEYTEINRKDNIVFVAANVKLNPFEESGFYFPYEMLRTEAKLLIESFQLLD